jgi:hypothetical protein
MNNISKVIKHSKEISNLIELESNTIRKKILQKRLHQYNKRNFEIFFNLIKNEK